MYISLVSLTSKDTYKQHQDIWSLFPNTPTRKRDHLFRVEQENGNTVVALLQSSSAPVSSQQATVLQSKTFEPKLTNGDYYKFKLVALPTKCLSPSKKVIELKDEPEQIQWLQRKLPGANVTVTSLSNKLVANKKAHNSRFIEFEGVLQITDAEQVYAALVMGIGRKKHAGAGLLSLAKAS